MQAAQGVCVGVMYVSSGLSIQQAPPILSLPHLWCKDVVHHEGGWALKSPCGWESCRRNKPLRF